MVKWVMLETHINAFILEFYFSVVLWSGCFVSWVTILTHQRINIGAWTHCKLYYFLFFFGIQYSSMLLVLMSVEKCYALYFPLKSKTVCNVKRAQWATGIVGIVLAGSDSVYFFVIESRSIDSCGRQGCIYIAQKYRVTLNIIDSVLYSYLPFILIFMTNSAIAFKFMTAQCKSNSTESTNQALAKAATRGTAMVVSVTVMFLLLTSPTAMYAVLYGWYSLVELFPWYRTFMNLTQYLNHSINGILYCVVGSRFRAEILKIFCRREKSTNSEITTRTAIERTGSK